MPKKVFLRNYNSVYSQLLPYLNRTTNLLEASLYLGWNDIIEPDKKICELAKKYKVKSILLEHGMHAVSDYSTELVDTIFNPKPKQLIADEIMVWGNRSKETLLRSGIEESRIKIVGSPIIWESHYTYIHKAANKKVEFGTFFGKSVINPTTNETFEFLENTHEIPKRREDAKLITFFPGHQTDTNTVTRAIEIYKELEGVDNLFIVLSPAWMEFKINNPFIELIKMTDISKKTKKCINLNLDMPLSIDVLRSILKNTAVAITTHPGTINGICWAMDVPIINIKYDIGFRSSKDNNIVYDLHQGDYVIDDVKKLNSEISGILKEDVKKEDRVIESRYQMGTELGYSGENILRVIYNNLK